MAKNFGRKNMYLDPLTNTMKPIPAGWEIDDSYDGLGRIGSQVDDPQSDVTEEKTVTKDALGNETTIVRKNAENNPTARFNKFKEQQEQSNAQTAAPSGGAGTGGRKAKGNRPTLSDFDNDMGAGRGGRKGRDFIDEALLNQGSGGRSGRGDNFIDESLFDQGSGGRSSNGPGQDFGFDEYFPTPEELQRKEMDNAQTAAGKQGFAPIGRDVPGVPELIEKKLGFADAAGLNTGSAFDNLGAGHPGNFSGYTAPEEINPGRGNIVEQDNERGKYMAPFDSVNAAAWADARIDEAEAGAWQGRPTGGDTPESLITSASTSSTPFDSRFEHFGGPEDAGIISAPHPQSKGPEGQALFQEHRANQLSERNLDRIADVEARINDIQLAKDSGTLASTKTSGKENKLLRELEELQSEQEILDGNVTETTDAASQYHTDDTSVSEFDAAGTLGSGPHGEVVETELEDTESQNIHTDQDIIDSDDGEETATEALAKVIAGPGGSTGTLTAAETGTALMNSDETLSGDIQYEAANIVSQSPEATDAVRKITEGLAPRYWEEPEETVKKAGGLLDGLFGGDNPMMQQAILSMLIGWLSTGSISQGAAAGLQSYQNQLLGQQEAEQAKIDDAAKLEEDNKKERLALTKAGYTPEQIEAYQNTGDEKYLNKLPDSKEIINLREEGKFTKKSIAAYAKSGNDDDLKEDTYKEIKAERLDLLNKGYSKESIKAYQQSGDYNKLVKSSDSADPEKQRLDLKKGGYTNASILAYQQSGDFNDLRESTQMITGNPSGSKWVDGARRNYWNAEDGQTYYRNKEGDIMQAAPGFETIEEYDPQYHSKSAQARRIKALGEEYAASAMEGIPASEKNYNHGVSAPRISRAIIELADTYGLDASNLPANTQASVGIAVEEMALKNYFLHSTGKPLEKDVGKYIKSQIIRSSAFDANVPTGSFLTEKTGEVNHEAIGSAYKIVRSGATGGRSDSEVWSILADQFSSLSEGKLKDAKKGGKKHNMSPFLYYVNNTSFTH